MRVLSFNEGYRSILFWKAQLEPLAEFGSAVDHGQFQQLWVNPELDFNTVKDKMEALDEQTITAGEVATGRGAGPQTLSVL